MAAGWTRPANEEAVEETTVHTSAIREADRCGGHGAAYVRTWALLIAAGACAVAQTLPNINMTSGSQKYQTTGPTSTGTSFIVGGTASVMVQDLNTSTAITLKPGFTAVGGTGTPTGTPTFRALIGPTAASVTPPPQVNVTQQVNVPASATFTLLTNPVGQPMAGGYVTLQATDGSGYQCPVEFVIGPGQTVNLSLTDTGTTSDGTCTINTSASSTSIGSEVVTLTLSLTLRSETYAVTTATVNPDGTESPVYSAGTWTVDQPWNFTMTAPSSSPVTATPTGAQGSYSQTFQPANGFTGQVSISYTYNGGALPPGLSISPGTLWVSGSTPTTFIVTAAQGTTAASYPIIITATAAGLVGTITQTSSLTVVVTPPPYFSITQPSEIFLTNNSTFVGFTQTITGLYGFRSPVSVSIAYIETETGQKEANPNQLYVTYNPSSWTPDPVTGIVTVSGQVEALSGYATPGIYYVYGTATSGSLQQTFAFGVDVSSSVTQTITSNVPGAAVIVDGTSCTTPCYFQWGANTQHTLNTTSPQSWTTGTRYIFENWSGPSGQTSSQTYSFTAGASSATYTVDFYTQYQLTTYASPASEGTITPSAGSYWYNAGTNVTISALAYNGFQFAGFVGALTGTTTPQSLMMSGPESVTATFPSDGPGTVALINASHPFTALEPNDYAQVSIYNAAPNGEVDLCPCSVPGSNPPVSGCDGNAPVCQLENYGQTDINGNWNSLLYYMSPATVQDWTEFWYVDGTAVPIAPRNSATPYAPTLPKFTVYPNYTASYCAAQSTVPSICPGNGPGGEHWDFSPVPYYSQTTIISESTVDAAAKGWNSVQGKVTLGTGYYPAVYVYEDVPPGGVTSVGNTTIDANACSPCYDYIDVCTGSCFNAAGIWLANVAIYSSNAQTSATALGTTQANIEATAVAHELGHGPGARRHQPHQRDLLRGAEHHVRLSQCSFRLRCFGAEHVLRRERTDQLDLC